MLGVCVLQQASGWMSRFRGLGIGAFLIQLDPCWDKTEEPVSYWQKSATVHIQTPRFGLKAPVEFNLQWEPVKSNVYFETSHRELFWAFQDPRFLSRSDIPSGTAGVVSGSDMNG